MAVPKKKTSKSRRDMRRYSYSNRLKEVAISSCSQCGEPSRPHSVCRCGYYAGREIFKAKVKSEATTQ